MTKHHEFLRAAIAEAEKAALKGDVPVGCVIVQNDEIIARGHNLREAQHDPTGHAEIIALRRAGEHLKRWQLSDCDLYVTHEPCPMCAGALVMARIHTLYYGCDEPLTGACGSRLNLVQFPGFPHNIHVVGPLAQEACAALTRRFFKEKRQ